MTDPFIPPLKEVSRQKPVKVAVVVDEVTAVETAPAPTLTADEATTAALPTAPLVTDAVLPLVDADTPSTVPALTIVDTVFFYGRSATGSTLYQVDVGSGSLAAVVGPVALFSTALDGLFTAAPGGLGGSAEVSTEPPLRTFALVEGTSGKNFLIGTAADNALLGFGGDDLILTGRGYNLAFGGSGNDTLVGGVGDNGLFGGNGDDAIEGGVGDDLLVGGAGDDILYGGGGANTLIGGAGADVFRLNSPGAYGSPEAYGPLVGDATAVIPETDTILDFNVVEGDLLDLSLIAAQPLFAGRDLLPFVSFVQVEADTHVQITTPLGQVSTEAILVGVEADTITPASIILTPPTGVPLLK